MHGHARLLNSARSGRQTRPQQHEAQKQLQRSGGDTTASSGPSGGVGAAAPPAAPPKAAAKLSESLCLALQEGHLEALELGAQLPVRCLERIAAALRGNSSLRRLSLAGSGAGDGALKVRGGARVQEGIRAV